MKTNQYIRETFYMNPIELLTDSNRKIHSFTESTLTLFVPGI